MIPNPLNQIPRPRIDPGWLPPRNLLDDDPGPGAEWSAGVLYAQRELRSRAIAEEVAAIPEIAVEARRIAESFRGLDHDMNFEAALRVSVLQYLHSVTKRVELGPKMGLMIRMLESALCFIDWTIVAESIDETAN